LNLFNIFIFSSSVHKHLNAFENNQDMTEFFLKLTSKNIASKKNTILKNIPIYYFLVGFKVAVCGMYLKLK